MDSKRNPAEPELLKAWQTAPESKSAGIKSLAVFFCRHFLTSTLGTSSRMPAASNVSTGQGTSTVVPSGLGHTNRRKPIHRYTGLR